MKLSGPDAEGPAVPVAARQRLADLLGEITAPGSFSAQRSAPVDDLHLEVRGIGTLRLPVPDRQAEQLCRVARPAPYGKGSRTLVDPKVRHTWQVPNGKVKVDKRRWDKTLTPMLERLRDDLGPPPPASWSPSCTPCSCSKTSLSFVAFYPDCRHEVKPVTSGHRVVLTYNLLARRPAAPPAEEEAPQSLGELTSLVEEHFSTKVVPSSYSRDAPAEPPARLVYLLDHEYTERGLSWSRLKGDDATRAAALRAAAARAGCDIVLALAELHETWDAWEPEPSRCGRRWRWRDWDEDDEDDDWDEDGGSSDADSYELTPG